ncbi:ABC transporter ATP-binding protein [Roseibium sp. AS2]|uniref:ABC transporter ATP-binding protein n=1 Tax=Roseibium sp. AS2 TaxID=3135781 RepID=UPI003171904A
MSQQDQAPVVVSLRNIRKAFDTGTTALDNFSLDIREGEFVSLLGPSGCGKSSALRIIAGLSEPSAGGVEWPAAQPDRKIDRERNDRDLIDRDLAFVFQEPTLMPWASVFDNVWLPLRARWVSRERAREQVMDALATVGLEDATQLFPRELSGGMKMRVSIARALITRPRVLLMDEPFAALDEITRFKLNNDLLRLQASFGWTVLFVTHSVFESVYLSSRIVVMAAAPGRVSCEKMITPSQPRDDAFRNSRQYSLYCQEVSTALQTAMDPQGMG